MRVSMLIGAIACTLAASACSGSSGSQPAADAQAPAAAAPPASSPEAPASAPAASAPAASAPAASASTPPVERAASAPAATSATPPASADAPAPAAPPPPAPPPPPPAPTHRELTIPEGTTLSIVLETPLSSDGSKVEDRVRGSLSEPVRVSGSTAIPAGAAISGSVIETERSGRVKGRARIVFQFDRMVVRGESTGIRTATVTHEAEANRKDDVVKGGVGAGVGAIVGGIVGGGKGAAIGAGAGGTGAVLATRGSEVKLPAGRVVSARLTAPLTVMVPIVK